MSRRLKRAAPWAEAQGFHLADRETCTWFDFAHHKPEDGTLPS